MPILQTPHIAVLKPRTIVIYKDLSHVPRKEKTEIELANLEKGKNGEYNGYMSPATSRNVKKILSNWLIAIDGNMKRNNSRKNKNKYYPTFVTLTLPAEQAHDDNFIKRHFLERFRSEMKRKFNVQYSFWRAEPQANGNIHFHLLFDRWIHWAAIRSYWNKILDEYGYIDSYRKAQQDWHKNGFKPRKNLLKVWTLPQQFTAYQHGVKTNWSDPNTTDVHKIDKCKSITAYVTKYVAKDKEKGETRDYKAVNEQGELVDYQIECVSARVIEGRIWGCSDQIKELKFFSDLVHEEIVMWEHGKSGETRTVIGNDEMIDYLEAVQKELKPDDIWQDDNVIVYRLPEDQPDVLKRLSPSLYFKYCTYYADMFKMLYSFANVQDKQPPEQKANEVFVVTPLDSCPF